MAAGQFKRWDKALKLCTDAKKGDGKNKGNRWNNDVMVLNTEAHQLPVEKQRMALDFVEAASEDLRAKVAPMWKYCFVQWHIYDAGVEALDQKKTMEQGMEDPLLQSDINSLLTLLQNGDLEKASVAAQWTWKMLDPFPPAGSLARWSEEVALPMIQVGREERKEGIKAYEKENYPRAFFHFWQGLKLIARAPGSTSGPIAKLRSDIWKNKSAAALKMGMPRVALSAANEALIINIQDEKAWYRKSCALQALSMEEEAQVALLKAGLSEDLTKDEVPAPLTMRAVPGQPQEPPVFEEGELEPSLHKMFEGLLFVEMGVDSITIVDLIMHIQGELHTTPIPLGFFFDYPRVYDAVTELLRHINAHNETSDEIYYRRQMNSTLWRAICRALGRDAIQDMLRGRRVPMDWPEYSEGQALQVLGELKAAYERDGWVQTTQSLAKRVSFEQRPFLMGLQPKALEVQRPILEKYGFDPDEEGLKSLECGIIHTAQQSKRVTEELQSTRMALQGGPNGIWAVNMDSEAGFCDMYSSMQARTQYTKTHPFGPGHINTNSTYNIPRMPRPL